MEGEYASKEGGGEGTHWIWLILSGEAYAVGFLLLALRHVVRALREFDLWVG